MGVADDGSLYGLKPTTPRSRKQGQRGPRVEAFGLMTAHQGVREDAL